MILRFDHWEIDADLRELRRDGCPVHVEPQVFDVIVYLAQNRDRVVSKDELYAHVWKGRIVSEATLSSRINAARKALEDSGDRQQRIRTVARRGFRFTAELRDDGPEAAKAASLQPPAPVREPGLPVQAITTCRTSGGINLAVATVGEGPPLVKVANWINHLEFDWQSPLFAPLFRRLAQRHRFIRYDGRGIGLSDWDIGELDFEDLVRDLEAVVDSLGLERFSLFGMSQGAGIAVAYAARHPHRVDRMVLHGGYAQGRQRRASAAEREQAEAFTTLMRYGWGDAHSAFMRAFSSIYLPNGTAEQIRWFSDMQRVSTSADNAIALRKACDRIDVRADLPRVAAPTLVTHSRHDQVAPFEQGRLLAASIPNARLATLESENHVILQEEAAWTRWIEEIERFLA